VSTPVIRVVIVDDEDDARELLRTRLEQTGRFTVVAEGSSAPEALDLSQQHQPHVLILDEVMHGLTGLDVVPDIVKVAPNTAIVIYTAHSRTATRDEAARAGAHAVVGKLNDFSLLTGVIDRILGLTAAQEGEPKQTESEEAFAHRMAALLETPEHRRTFREWWSATGTRWWVILLAFLSVPFVAVVVWLIAKLAGFIPH
jgi:DNA-binding NarL/FixJ family response regulator